MKVLVIVSHPDDESLFCGAAIAKHAERGDEVNVVSMGNGVGARGATPEAEIVARLKAFRKACDILGAERNKVLETFPDQQADTVPQLQINKAVEDVIETYKPELIYTHHVGDLNIDHRRVAEAVLVATRMGPTVRCMTPEFPDRCVGRKFKPNVRPFFGCFSAMDKKIAACLCYQSELRAYPHPRSERALREKGAESFMEIR